MTDAEREALVERMAKSVVINRVGDEKAWNALPASTKARVRKDMRAALSEAERVVRDDEREECCKALEEMAEVEKEPTRASALLAGATTIRLVAFIQNRARGAA